MDIVQALTPLVVIGLAYWIVSLFELPDPLPKAIKVVVVVAVVLYLLGFLGKSF